MTPVPIKPYLAYGFVLVMVVVLCGGTALFRHHVATTPKASPTPVVHDSWRDLVTSPVATPSPVPYHPVATTLPTTVVPTPPPQLYQAQPRVDPQAEQRHQRYLRALASDISIPHQVAETPQLTSNGPIMVNSKPAPRYTVLAWSWLPAVLTTGINSDHPGDVLATVTSNIFDTVSESDLLIPIGSKLHGTQTGRAGLQQVDESIIVMWDDIELPNGAHIPIPHMPGADPQGYPGLKDLVDKHAIHTWLPAILMAGVGAASSLATHPTYGGYEGYDSTQQATTAAASQLTSHANQQLQQDISMQKPTITIRQGYKLQVLVTRDLIFPGAYK